MNHNKPDEEPVFLQQDTTSESTSHLPRKERERNRHRDEVLHATEKLLVSRHYQDVGVKDIAAEAEFSVGYIYKLFPSKEEIMLSLVRLKMEERRGIIQSLISSQRPFLDRFDRLIESLEQWQKDNMAFHPSIVGAALDLIKDSPETRDFITRHELAVRKMLESFFGEAIDTGCLYAENAGIITDSFQAVMKGFFMYNMRFCLHENSETAQWKSYGPTLRTLILRAYDPKWFGGPNDA